MQPLGYEGTIEVYIEIWYNIVGLVQFYIPEKFQMPRLAKDIR